MALFEIPIETTRYVQTFSVELSGTTYDFRLVYSERAACYYLDISVDGEALAYGLTVVNRFNLLEDLDVPGALYCLPIRSPDEIPSLGELGLEQRCSLVYETEDG